MRLQRDRVERVSLVVGLLLFCGILKFSLGSDGSYRYDMVQALVDERRIAAPPPSPDHGPGKRQGARSAPSIVQPIAAAPLYVAGKLIGMPERTVRRFNLVVFAGMLLLVSWRLAPRTDAALLSRWFLLMLTCSMFPHHLRMFFAEVFSGAATIVGLTCLVTGAPFVGALSLAVAIANTPVLAVPVGLVGLALAIDEKKRWLVFLPVLGLLGFVAENWLRRGGPFVTGYEGNKGFATVLPYSGLPGFSFPLILGVASILFSFGKGLLFFAPGLTLARTDTAALEGDAPLRRLQHLMLLFVAGMIVIYAKWWSWHGGWFWGPRFFLLASVPASLALAVALGDLRGSLAKNLLVLGVLALSCWVGINGAIFGQDGLDKIGLANDTALEGLVWYVPQFSPLWYPFIEHGPILPRDWIVGGYCVLTALWVGAPLLRRVAGQLTVGVHAFAAHWNATPDRRTPVVR